MKDYSQFGEQEQILAVFAGLPPGRFLDIGAFDGETYSNSRALYELGWGGVVVEPNAPAFARLTQLYSQVDRVVCVNAAVLPSGPPRLVRFYSSRGEGLSTTEEWHKKAWGACLDSHYVAGLTTADLVAGIGQTGFDFVTVDTEGTNAAVFASLPLRAWGVRAAIVEYDRFRGEADSGRAQCEAYAASEGFRLRWANDLNLLFERHP